ncbi:MAG: ComF family protein, partial [Mycobacterium sp.]
MLDLVLPLQCGGCGVAGVRWCVACDRELTVRPDQPHLVTPRLDPGVPVLSLGRYAG